MGRKHETKTQTGLWFISLLATFSRCWMHIWHWTDAVWPSASLPAPTSWVISPQISTFNPLLFPSSLIPADRGLGTTNTQGLEGPFSLCNSFTCMGARAHVWIFIIARDVKWVTCAALWTWRVCANVARLHVSGYSCAQVCPSKCYPPEKPPWWADLFVE